MPLRELTADYPLLSWQMILVRGNWSIPGRVCHFSSHKIALTWGLFFSALMRTPRPFIETWPHLDFQYTVIRQARFPGTTECPHLGPHGNPWLHDTQKLAAGELSFKTQCHGEWEFELTNQRTKTKQKNQTQINERKFTHWSKTPMPPGAQHFTYLCLFKLIFSPLHNHSESSCLVQLLPGWERGEDRLSGPKRK